MASPCEFTGSARDFLPGTRSLTALRAAARKCRGCALYCHATQAVFGEGPKTAQVMFIGEQPGDQEDRAGRPFVGPAGRVLDEAFAEVGIDRKHVYLTNAVKHFKFTPRGKRRIHAKPSVREVGACLPWLEMEIQTIGPQLLVCLGATAAQALLGSGFKVTRQRGQVFTDTPWAPCVMATVHPSSLLRLPDEPARRVARAAFIADLTIIRAQMDPLPPKPAARRREPAPLPGRDAPARDVETAPPSPRKARTPRS